MATTQPRVWRYSTLWQSIGSTSTSLRVLIRPKEKSTGAEFNHSHVSRYHPGRHVPSFPATVVSSMNCVTCKGKDTHSMPAQNSKLWPMKKGLTIIKSNSVCLNWLHPGHHAKKRKSAHQCRQCQRLYHTLLHITKTRLWHLGIRRWIVDRDSEHMYLAWYLDVDIDC